MERRIWEDDRPDRLAGATGEPSYWWCEAKKLSPLDAGQKGWESNQDPNSSLTLALTPLSERRNGLTVWACKRQSMEFFNQSNPIFGCSFQTWPELNVCLRGRVEAGFQVSRSCLCIVLCLTQIIHKVPCPRCSDSLHSKRFYLSYYAKVGAFGSRPNTFHDELARKRLLHTRAG